MILSPVAKLLVVQRACIVMLIAVMLAMEVSGKNSSGTYLTVLVPLSVIIPFALLRSVKGGLIGILWARGLSDELDR